MQKFEHVYQCTPPRAPPYQISKYATAERAMFSYWKHLG